MLFQHRDPLGELHHDLQKGRSDKHALHEHLGAIRGGLLPHLGSSQLAPDRLAPPPDDLLPQRDEARPPPGLQPGGAGAGDRDPGPLLGGPGAGEPPRLSVRGKEGEDGGDAGALLKEEKMSGLGFGGPHRLGAYLLFLVRDVPNAQPFGEIRRNARKWMRQV